MPPYVDGCARCGSVRSGKVISGGLVDRRGRRLRVASTIDRHRDGEGAVSLGATAYVDEVAGRASASLGADGYALGDQVAFASPAPSLFVAAHEAAHVMQASHGVHRSSRAPGGDDLERHADAVAERVVRGERVDDFRGRDDAVIASPAVRRHDGPPTSSAPPAGNPAPAVSSAAPTTSGAPADASTAPAAAGAAPADAAAAEHQASAALQTFHADVSQAVPASSNPPAPAPAGPVCHVDLSSRPLNEALSAMMRAEGMAPAQVTAVWAAVQRRTAGAYGELYDQIGGLQRAIYALISVAEILERFPTLTGVAATLRATLATTVTDALARLHVEIKHKIAAAAVDAIQQELHRTVPCLTEQVAAAVDGALPASSFGTPDMSTGTSREIRYRATTQFAAYRTAVQAATERLAGTTFRPIVTGDATGMHMEMLTAADQTARLGTVGNRLDAGHLHMDGASAADTQDMAWDVYQMQATSNNANGLIRDLVAGTSQSFDVVLHAVRSSPAVDRDAFINNQVDLDDIHADPAMPAAGSTSHPQSQQSVYAHFLHERRFDATHNATDMSVIEAQGRALETQRLQLVSDLAALPARVQAAINGGAGAVTPPLNPAETAQANAWITRAQAWRAAQTANDAAFNARFPGAHGHAVDQENAFNRELGFDDTRPH